MSEFSTHFDFILNSIEQMACIFKEADKFAAVNNQAADFLELMLQMLKGKLFLLYLIPEMLKGL